MKQKLLSEINIAIFICEIQQQQRQRQRAKPATEHYMNQRTYTLKQCKRSLFK